MSGIRDSIRFIMDDDCADNLLEIKEYENKYQNQVMVLSMKSLLESVDEDNREYELKYLVDALKDNLYQQWMVPPENHAWVLVDVDDVVYGFMAVRTWNGVGLIQGIHVDVILRKRGWASRLLQETIDFCRSKNCFRLATASATYSEEVLEFYKKHDFKLTGRKWENDGKLQIVEYTLTLL